MQVPVSNMGGGGAGTTTQTAPSDECNLSKEKTKEQGWPTLSPKELDPGFPFLSVQLNERLVSTGSCLEFGVAAPGFPRLAGCGPTTTGRGRLATHWPALPDDRWAAATTRPPRLFCLLARLRHRRSPTASGCCSPAPIRTRNGCGKHAGGGGRRRRRQRRFRRRAALPSPPHPRRRLE